VQRELPCHFGLRRIHAEMEKREVSRDLGIVGIRAEGLHLELESLGNIAPVPIRSYRLVVEASRLQGFPRWRMRRSVVPRPNRLRGIGYRPLLRGVIFAAVHSTRVISVCVRAADRGMVWRAFAGLAMRTRSPARDRKRRP
jgi:hypothetical protein